MIIKNNTVAVISVAVVGKPAIVLIPGENVLSKDQFESLMGNPVVKERILNGEYSLKGIQDINDNETPKAEKNVEKKVEKVVEETSIEIVEEIKKPGPKKGRKKKG